MNNTCLPLFNLNPHASITWTNVIALYHFAINIQYPAFALKFLSPGMST